MEYDVSYEWNKPSHSTTSLDSCFNMCYNSMHVPVILVITVEWVSDEPNSEKIGSMSPWVHKRKAQRKPTVTKVG